MLGSEDRSLAGKALSWNVRVFVGYCRVSSGRQAASGLGLEAQQRAINDYVADRGGRLITIFFETASGRKEDRPKLANALSLCRIARATLVIARLDRLSRSVELVARLADSGLDFVAADFPEANRFTLHILAAVAEYESGLQSERMKATIAALKARGTWKPSRHFARRFPPGCQLASAIARRARAAARAADLAPLIRKGIAEGKSYAVIANEFNADGISPPRDAPWSKNSVLRTLSLADSELSLARAGVGRRNGVAQIKVARRVQEIGVLLLEWRSDRRSWTDIGRQLDRRGLRSPWGKPWGPSSLQRYFARAQSTVGALSDAGDAT